MKIDPYLVGILYGDGWTYVREAGSYVTCIDQAEKNKEIIIQEVIPRFKKMGFRVNPYVFFAKHDSIFKWRAQVYSKGLYLQLKETFPRIVSYFETLQADEAKQFIAGFIDAEGTIAKGAIIIYNQNEALLDAVQKRFRDFGIAPTYIYPYNVVKGLVIMRRECVKKLIQEVPAMKFRKYHDKQVIQRALKE